MKPSLFLFSVISGVVSCAAYYPSYSARSWLNIRNLYTRQCDAIHGQTRTIGDSSWLNWGSQSIIPTRFLSMRASRNNDDAVNPKGQKHKPLAPKYYPKTPNQRLYLNYLNDPAASIILGIGPAGTGKTLFACISAIEMLRRGEIHKIVLTRPVVAVEEELGFLPGNMVMKMDPWTRPIFDIFLEFYSQKDIDAMIQAGTIEISPLAYMRGRTFKRAFIIADEMQNSSPNQMLMLITRIGEHSKMVITGDLKQSDRFADNGLRDFTDRLYSKTKRTTHDTPSNHNPDNEHTPNCTVYSLGGIRAVELTSSDIERSEIVKQVLTLYEPIHQTRVWYQSNPNISNSTLSTSTMVANTEHVDIVGTMDAVSPVNNELLSVEFYNNVTTDTISSSVHMDSSFELISNDDAALIPKKHYSKYFQGENFNQYSTGKWQGW